jgi:hypothetical protein
MPDGDLVWRKSTHCETTFCVELTRHDIGNYIRNSKNAGQKLDMPVHAVQLLIGLIRDSR